MGICECNSCQHAGSCNSRAFHEYKTSIAMKSGKAFPKCSNWMEHKDIVLFIIGDYLLENYSEVK